MEEIAKFIGHGRVRLENRQDGRSQAVLTIYDKTVLINKIVPIFDGRLISDKKIIQFNNWKRDLYVSGSIKPGPKIIHPEWLVGFTDGDGSFYPMIHRANDYKCGFQVQLVFDLAQDGERELLIKISDQFFNQEHK